MPDWSRYLESVPEEHREEVRAYLESAEADVERKLLEDVERLEDAAYLKWAREDQEEAARAQKEAERVEPAVRRRGGFTATTVKQGQAPRTPRTPNREERRHPERFRRG